MNRNFFMQSHFNLTVFTEGNMDAARVASWIDGLIQKFVFD